MSSPQVTKEVCQEIINKKVVSCNKEVITFSVKEQNTTAFANTYILKISVRNCVDKQYSFVLKTPSKEWKLQFDKELSVYNVLPLKQNICAPYFYCSNDMLVVDDLLNCGYKFCSEKSLDEAHVNLALRKIAEFHTLNLNNGIEENASYLEYITTCHQQFLEEINEMKLKTLEKSDFEKKLVVLFEQMLENLKPSKELKNVVTHGELRKENLLFAYEDGVPVDCKLTNFYFSHYSPPANDVLFFILNCTSEEQRTKHFTEYLEYYFCCFKKCQSNIESEQWDDFYLSCKTLLPANKLRSAYYALGEKYKIVRKLEDVLTNGILSEEDCYTILNNKLGLTDYTLQSFNVKGFSERCGFLGDHFTLNINVLLASGEQDLSFFVKTVPSVPSQREFSMANGAVFKEYRMFTKFIPMLNEYEIKTFEEVTPKVYFCRLNDVMVQENLSQLGFANLDRNSSLGLEEMALALKVLAKFHASSIILEEKISKERGYTYRLNQEYQKEFKEIFYTREHQMIAETFEACKSGARASVDTFYSGKETIKKDTLRKLLEAAIDKQAENVKPSKIFRNTITHGDLWVNNILFKYEDGLVQECKIVDFQSYRYHPPAHDVLGLLYLTTNREFRKKHFTEMLNIYYEELSKTFLEYGLHNVITKQEFEDSCKFYKESVMTQTMTHFQVIIIPDDISKYLFNNPDELRNVFFKNKYKFMKETMAKNANFRNRNEECFLDLLEHFQSKGVNL